MKKITIWLIILLIIICIISIILVKNNSKENIQNENTTSIIEENKITTHTDFEKNSNYEIINSESNTDFQTFQTNIDSDLELTE